MHAHAHPNSKQTATNTIITYKILGKRRGEINYDSGKRAKEKSGNIFFVDELRLKEWAEP